MQQNIFQDIPHDLTEEIFQELLSAKNIRIERIISKGQTSPKEGWYDQEEHEWVILLQGAATLSFETADVKLSKGDYYNIKAHQKHRVTWTKKDEITIWLAIFYN